MIITFTKINSLTIVNIQSAIGGQGKTNWLSSWIAYWYI